MKYLVRNKSLDLERTAQGAVVSVIFHKKYSSYVCETYDENPIIEPRNGAVVISMPESFKSNKISAIKKLVSGASYAEVIFDDETTVTLHNPQSINIVKYDLGIFYLTFMHGKKK